MHIRRAHGLHKQQEPRLPGQPRPRCIPSRTPVLRHLRRVVQPATPSFPPYPGAYGAIAPTTPSVRIIDVDESSGKTPVLCPGQEWTAESDCESRVGEPSRSSYDAVIATSAASDTSTSPAHSGACGQPFDANRVGGPGGEVVRWCRVGVRERSSRGPKFGLRYRRYVTGFGIGGVVS